MTKIIKLCPGDHELARQLFVFFQEDDGVANPDIPGDEHLKNLLKKPDLHVLVAIEGELAGGLTAYELNMYKRQETKMFLYEIGVKPAFRRQGIAAGLIEALLHICREKGIVEVFVWTSAGNEMAMALYRSTRGTPEPNGVSFTYLPLNL